MATTTKKPKASRYKHLSRFIDKGQLAHELADAAPASIDEWIADGTIPPPHSRPGERKAVWLREHFEYYVKHRQWPAEAFAAGQGDQGSVG